jgi:hypothetical protein
MFCFFAHFLIVFLVLIEIAVWSKIICVPWKAQARALIWFIAEIRQNRVRGAVSFFLVALLIANNLCCCHQMRINQTFNIGNFSPTTETDPEQYKNFFPK